MRHRRSRLLALGLLLGPLACGPEPHYDDAIGLTGVAVAPGALAGTFALKLELITETELPLIGNTIGGGATFVLVERQFDDAAGAYTQTHQLCGGFLKGDVSTSYIPDESWQKVPPTTPPVVETRDADGFVSVKGHLELWGLAGLDNPYTDPIPNDDVEAATEPHKSHIVDMDEDGNPGVTVAVEGIVNGDFFFIQRKVTDLEGVVLSEDRLVGLHQNDFKQTIIGAANAPVQQGYPTFQHADPKQTWFEEIRLPDGSGCDAVLDAAESEALSKFRPF